MKESSLANACYRIISTHYVIKLALSFCNNSGIKGAQLDTKFGLSLKLTQEDTQELFMMVMAKDTSSSPYSQKRNIVW